MTLNRLPDYIDQMLEATHLAASYVEGINKADFVEDKRTQQAGCLCRGRAMRPACTPWHSMLF